MTIRVPVETENATPEDVSIDLKNELPQLKEKEGNMQSINIESPLPTVGNMQSIDIESPLPTVTGVVVQEPLQLSMQRREALYCPITQKEMTDPVVDSSGNSFERTAVGAEHDRGDGSLLSYYWPNRALKAILELNRTLQEEDGNMLRKTLRKLDDSVRANLLDKTGVLEYRPLPDAYYCPITCDLMKEPVLTPDGITYEREAIETWIKVNGLSPTTRDPLSIEELRPNNNLQKLLTDEREKSDETIHPSIRRWKEELEQERLNPTQRPALTDIVTVDTDVTAPQHPYPTTEEQIAARRRQKVVRLLTFVFVFILIFGVIAAFPFPTGIIAALVLLFLLIPRRGGSESGSEQIVT